MQLEFLRSKHTNLVDLLLRQTLALVLGAANLQVRVVKS